MLASDDDHVPRHIICAGTHLVYSHHLDVSGTNTHEGARRIERAFLRFKLTIMNQLFYLSMG
jgi:hypothetical protein